MNEVEDSSVDIIITSPPYNIKHKYITYEDNLITSEYLKMLDDFIAASFKKLKGDGILVIDIADFIFYAGKSWNAAHYIICQCSKVGFIFKNKSIYLAKDEKPAFSMHSDLAQSSYLNESDYDHSPIQIILEFEKTMGGSIKSYHRFQDEYDYSSSVNDAFWPSLLIRDMIKRYEIQNKIILDPFMGGGQIGLAAIEESCHFIGYEVEEVYIQQFIE